MEYDLAFSQELIAAAEVSKQRSLVLDEAKRAVLYLSLLSIEISLKYLLERAGVPVKEIRKCSHSFQALLKKLDSCEVPAAASEPPTWVPASRIRSRIVNPAYANATVGTFLSGETVGASKYPSEIRYGQSPHHFPFELQFDCAVMVAEWAEEYGETIRVKPSV